MFEIVLSVLVISSIGAVLAGVLVYSERVIANYGPCEIDINGEKQLTVEGGGKLLDALTDEKIFIPSACGGRGTCGYCKCKVLSGAGVLLPTEEPFLDDAEKLDNIRLTCQVKVREDIKLQIPPELLSVKEYTCKCIDIKDLTYDVKQFRFELAEPATMDYVPGQYIQLLTPVYEKSSEEVYRAYSISSNPAQKNIIELVIRLVPNGICTTYCFEYLKVGDEVKINGPYGDFHLSDTYAPMIFVAGGSGMAPIKCLLHQMVNEKSERKAIFFFCGRSEKDLFYGELMRDFEEALNDFTYIPAICEWESGGVCNLNTGLVTEAIGRYIKDASEYEGYLCGSPGLIDAAVKVLKGLRMNEEKIYYDKFE